MVLKDTLGGEEMERLFDACRRALNTMRVINAMVPNSQVEEAIKELESAVEEIGEAHTPPQLWIVGKADEKDYLRWEFQGIFDNEQLASDACEGELWFIGPALLNAPVPTEAATWPGAYYPRLRKE